MTSKHPCSFLCGALMIRLSMLTPHPYRSQGGGEERNKKVAAGAKVSSIPKAASALGRSFSRRVGVLRRPGAMLGRSSATTPGRARAAAVPNASLALREGPIAKAATAKPPTSLVPTTKAAKAQPTEKEGASPPPLSIHALTAKRDAGRTAGRTRAVPTSGDQGTNVVVPPGAPREPSTGKDPYPPVPQAEDARASSVLAKTSTKMPPHRALTLMNCSTLLKHGALADARAALDRLGADLQDVEVRLANERLRLAMGWRQLDIAAPRGPGPGRGRHHGEQGRGRRGEGGS